MPSSASVWAVIVAAGRGTRFGGPKQFVEVAGKPLALWPLETFRAHPAALGVTLVVPEATLAGPPDWLVALQASGVGVVPGGVTRTDSVRCGLATVPGDAELVAVHDGARPLISSAAIGQVVAAGGAGHGAIAARPVSDSLKLANAAGRVARSLDRTGLWRAETPQVFPRAPLLEVHERAQAEGVHATDCAGLFERYGWEVVLVEIGEPNPKVTSAEDLVLVEELLKRRVDAADAGREP